MMCLLALNIFEPLSLGNVNLAACLVVFPAIHLFFPHLSIELIIFNADSNCFKEKDNQCDWKK